jgi:hypothetical protein
MEIPPGELLEGLDWLPAGPRVGRFRVSEDVGGDPEMN